MPNNADLIVAKVFRLVLVLRLDGAGNAFVFDLTLTPSVFAMGAADATTSGAG